MARFPVDIEYNQTSKGNGARDTVNSLKAIEDQANRTREKMAKLTEVGSKMALLGGAIIGPALLAMNKYVSTVKDAEPVSRRITELGKKWEESQVRLGRVTATIVLPALEKGAQILDNIVKFAEKYPGVVRAALTIGTTLIVLGGIVTTTAKLVSAVATLQGLSAATGGAALGGGGVAGSAAGTGGAILGAGAISAIASAVTSGIAAWAGANLGLIIVNALTGQQYTMQDFLNVIRVSVAAIGMGIDSIVQFFGGKSYFFQSFSDALGINRQQQAAIDRNRDMVNNSWLAKAFDTGILDIITAMARWFSGGHASGGYSGYRGFGLYGEKGGEFTLSSAVTKAWEAATGRGLTQENMLKWAESQKQMMAAYTASNKKLYSYANIPNSQLQAMAIKAQAATMSGNDLHYTKGLFTDTIIPKKDYTDSYVKAGDFNDTYFGNRRMNQTNNLQIGRGVTIAQMRREINANNKAIMQGLINL